MLSVYYCVVRLCLGKLLVNLLQVVKRTNTSLIPQQTASSTDSWFFWVVGSNPAIHNNKLFQTFPMWNLKIQNTVSGISRK